MKSFGFLQENDMDFMSYHKKSLSALQTQYLIYFSFERTDEHNESY